MSGAYSVSMEENARKGYIVAPSYSVDDVLRFPDVPIRARVNLDALLKAHSDANPVFVVRPLVILDEVSGNGVPYNRAIYDAVYDQVLNKGVVGRRGHVAAGDKPSAFPPDDAYWVGIIEDSTVYGKPTLFGKAYIVPGDTRDMVLSRDATGTPLSNSLWGDIAYSEDQSGELVPVSVTLESVDFVPEERAALQALGGDFVVTSEMKKGLNEMADENDVAAAEFKKACENNKPEAMHEMLTAAGYIHQLAEMHLKGAACTECDNAMSEMVAGPRRSKLAEMFMKEATPEETYSMLSEAIRKHVTECYAKESNMRLIPHEETKMQEGALAEMKSLKTQLSEMAEREKVRDAIIQRYERKDFESELDRAVDTYFEGFHVNTPKGEEGLANLKSTLRFRALSEMAGMKDGQAATNIKSGVEAAWPHVKPLTEMFIASAGGPPAYVGGAANVTPVNRDTQLGFDPATGRYTKEAAEIARQQANW